MTDSPSPYTVAPESLMTLLLQLSAAKLALPELERAVGVAFLDIGRETRSAQSLHEAMGAAYAKRAEIAELRRQIAEARPRDE